MDYLTIRLRLYHTLKSYHKTLFDEVILSEEYGITRERYDVLILGNITHADPVSYVLVLSLF